MNSAPRKPALDSRLWPFWLKPNPKSGLATCCYPATRCINSGESQAIHAARRDRSAKASAAVFLMFSKSPYTRLGEWTTSLPPIQLYGEIKAKVKMNFLSEWECLRMTGAGVTDRTEAAWWFTSCLTSAASQRPLPMNEVLAEN